MSLDNLTYYVITKTHPLSVCFHIAKDLHKETRCVFVYSRLGRHTKGAGTERREMQSVTMHTGLCDATYCLDSVEKRTQRLYGHVARKKTTRRLCPLLSLTRRRRNSDLATVHVHFCLRLSSRSRNRSKAIATTREISTWLMSA